MPALLPLLSRPSGLWSRLRLLQLHQPIRHATTKTKSSPRASPRTLAPPSKFNPPSHPVRAHPPHQKYTYGPTTSPSLRSYPLSMPAPGTFLHWFLTSRSLHVYITLGTLLSLAGFTFLTNFRRTSAFATMLPSASDLVWHPFSSGARVWEVLRLHTAAVGAETHARRQARMEDVAKRDRYRRAHGLNTDGFGGWTAKREGVEGVNLAEGIVAGGSVVTSGDVDAAARQSSEHEKQPKKPLRKWLGIW